MRNSTLRSVVAVAVAALFAVTPVFAELPFTGYRAVGPIAGVSTAADSDPVFFVKYIGSTAGKPTVEVSSGGDITLKIAGSVDATVGCPTHVTGIIDVSDTSCDTFIEVANAINMSDNWRAVLVNALGTDNANDSLATLSATDTNIRTTGVPLYYDTNYVSVLDPNSEVTVLVRPPGADGGFFFQGLNLNSNPFGGFTSFLSGVSEKKTSTGTIQATVIYGVTRVYSGVSRALSETIRTVWSQTGAATATQGTLDFSNFPLVSSPGEAFIVRIGSSTTISAQNLNAVGVLAQPAH